MSFLANMPSWNAASFSLMPSGEARVGRSSKHEVRDESNAFRKKYNTFPSHTKKHACSI